MAEMIVTVDEPFNVPTGNRAQWLTATHENKGGEFKRASYVLAARARKIAKTLGPDVKAGRLSGGWTLGPVAETRVLYVFDDATH